MTENSLKPAPLLDLVAFAATNDDTATSERRSLDDEQRSHVSHCFIGSAHFAHFAHIKTEGGYTSPAPEEVEVDSSTLPKDATGYPLLPQDKAGRSRFFVAVRYLVDGIADAYGCDQCPGNERAELLQQAAGSIEAVKCFVILAQQAGLRIGLHPCWGRWGLSSAEESI